ncbi:hypothetical protein ACPFUK_000142 [Vibrio cholerae]
MAIKVKNQTLAQSMNPFVVIQLSSGFFPRFLQHKSSDSSGKHVFNITSDISLAHKMPLVTAQVYLKQVQVHWPLAQIVG